MMAVNAVQVLLSSNSFKPTPLRGVGLIQAFGGNYRHTGKAT
jgi:hypothetical protein